MRAISAAAAVVSPAIASAGIQYYDPLGTNATSTVTTGSGTITLTSTNFTTADGNAVGGAAFIGGDTVVFAGTGAVASNASGGSAGADGTSNGTASSYIVTFSTTTNQFNVGYTPNGAVAGIVINNSGYYFNASNPTAIGFSTALSSGTVPTNANSALFVAAGKTVDFGNNVTIQLWSNGGANYAQRLTLDAGATLNIDAGATVNRSLVASSVIFAYAGAAGLAAATVNVAGTITKSATGDTSNLIIGQYAGEVDVNVNNGGLISTSSTGAAGSLGSIALGAYNTGAGVVTGALNINSGGSVVASDATTTDPYAGVGVGAVAGQVGIVNLNAGGTLTTQRVFKGAGTGTFNFNGGTLVANATTTSFMTGLTAANVLAGGATFNTGGFNVTVGQNLLASATSTGGGLTTIGAGGTLTLSGANTYTGTTNVSAGTLALSSSTSTNNIANSAKVFVASGATLSVAGVTAGTGFALASGQTLAGSGTVTGGTTIGTGAKITGGTGATAADTIGTLTTGAETLAAGTYAVKLNGTSAVARTSVGAGNAGAGTSDFLVIGGLTAASTSLTISPVGVSADVSGKLSPGGSSYSFLIAQIPAANVSPSSNFNASTLTLAVTQTPGVSPAGTYTLSSGLDGSSNDDLFLDFTPAAAPEPTSILLLGLTLAPLTVGRRRRRAAAATSGA